MDILDIDEILKDDSFFLLAENSQDDVTNILQQWRLNSSNPAQGTIFDTRTFTRPKRRSALNLEANFGNGSSKSDSIMHPSKNNVNLKVGGLVTSMQKSFLNDTSPPSSICSSMDVSTERMNNSLITSGDFMNVSFFNTNTDDILSDAHYSGYSLNDVIKDRKLLENLSLSGDSTIIKDLNIAQTDEISYLSKTNSGNSTMHNSTESMTNVLNETFAPLNVTVVENRNIKHFDVAQANEIENIATKLKIDTGIYDDDLLKDTTFSLIDSLSLPQKSSEDIMNSTVVISHPDENTIFLKKTDEILNSTFNKAIKSNNSLIGRNVHSDTFDKIVKNNVKNETFDLDEEYDIVNDMNVTYDNVGKRNSTFDDCGTPKFESKSGLNKQQSQSTPHQTPSAKTSIKNVVNISPIVPAEDAVISVESPSAQLHHDMNKSKFDQIEKYLQDMSDNFPNCEEPEKVNDHDFENDILDENEQFDNSMALLDGGKNEDEFDDMLDKLGKNIITAENIKMRQSLDNIKKRHSLANFEKTQENVCKQNGDANIDGNRSLHDSAGKSSLLSSSGSERLLSRRSRLFDDIQIMKNEQMAGDKKTNTTGKTDIELKDNKSIAEQKTEIPSSTKDDMINADNTDQEGKIHRKHDRDRFKTIRIFRNPNNELNVPCIDGDIENEIIEDQQPISSVEKARFSRKDQNSPTIVSNSNNSSKQKEYNIYTTYKKPKESALKKPNSDLSNEIQRPTIESGRQRSLSRPKHFSGYSKLDTTHNDILPKANSAGDLDTLKGPKIQRNLGNFGFSNKMSRIKQNSQPSLVPQATSNDKNAQLDRPSRTSLLSKTSSPRSQTDVDQNGTSAFKIPHPISNLRGPNSRRTGLVRPSSGFYCYNVNKNDSDNESGRYSPSNSISSASSKGSVQDIQQKCLNGHASDDNLSNESFRKDNDVVQVGQTKITAGKTSIPKPSGLRPPTNIRKSGLPRPASMIKR